VTFEKKPYLQLADNVSAFHDILPFTPSGPRPFLFTANLSVNRSVVQEVGGMLNYRKRAEDLEWTVRMRSKGYTLYFEPQAIIFHNPARYTWASLWDHWYDDAHDTLKVRNNFAQLLKTPHLARYRSIFLWGAPIIAAWATIRTFEHPKTISKFWHTFPIIYWTKLVWCCGAFKTFNQN